MGVDRIVWSLYHETSHSGITGRDKWKEKRIIPVSFGVKGDGYIGVIDLTHAIGKGRRRKGENRINPDDLWRGKPEGHVPTVDIPAVPNHDSVGLRPPASNHAPPYHVHPNLRRAALLDGEGFGEC